MFYQSLKKMMIAAAVVTTAVIVSTPAAVAQEMKTVRFGTPNLNLPYLPIYVADVMGYFTENGIEAEFETFKTGGATAMAALIGGNIDIFPGSSSAAMRAHDEGTGVVIAGALVTQYTSVLVARGDYLKERGISADAPLEEKLKLLKGAKLGVTSPGSGTDQLAHFLLRKAGLGPRDADMVYVGGDSAIVSTFAMGRVDIIVTSSPTTDVIMKDHGGVMLFNTAAAEIPELDGFPYITINTTRRFIDGDRPLAVATIKALAKAETVLHDPSKEEEVRNAVHEKYFPQLDKELFAGAWKSVLPAYPQTPAISEQQVDLAVNFLNEYSTDKFSDSARDAFTDELVREALAD